MGKTPDKRLLRREVKWSRRRTCLKMLLILCFLVTSVLVPCTKASSGWEAGGSVGFETNVDRSVDGGEDDVYVGAYTSWQRQPSTHSQWDWTFKALVEGSAFAQVTELSYVALRLAPGITYSPRTRWAVSLSPFLRGKAVNDSDQSALEFGVQLSFDQKWNKGVYTGQFYRYTDSNANVNTFSFTEHRLGIFVGVDWTEALYTEIGYAFSHGDSFRTLQSSSTTVSGMGMHQHYSSAFGAEVVREEQNRNSIWVSAGYDLTEFLFSFVGYQFTAVDGDLDDYTVNSGFIGIGYRF
jgi:hypothetical protein